MKKIYTFLLGIVGMLGFGIANAATAATAISYTTISTSLATEVTNAITGALPVAGLVLSAFIGYRIYKHFVRG